MPRTSKYPKDDFAIRLEIVRKAHGAKIGRARYDQEAFAKALGMGTEAYSRYERALSKPPFETLVRLVEITGVSLDWLVMGDDTKAMEPAPPAKRQRPQLRVHRN